MDSRSDSSDSGRRPAQPSSGQEPDLSLQGLLKQAEAAARAGKRIEARRLFREVLVRDSAYEDAWLWLAYLAPTPSQSLAYLQQARSHHPQSRRVREAIAWAQARLNHTGGGQAPQPPGAGGSEPAGPAPSEPAPPRVAGSRPVIRRTAAKEVAPQAERRRPAVPSYRPAGRPLSRERPRRHAPSGLLLTALALTVVALLVAILASAWRRGPGREPLGPRPGSTSTMPVPTDMATLRQLAGVAVSSQDWEHAIPLLEGMRQLSPEDGGVRQQLAVAHLRFGQQLVERDRIDEAIAHYDAAIRFYANDVDLQTARRLAIGYRDGRRAILAERWAEAVSLLEPVYGLASDFRDVGDLLFTAHMSQGAALEHSHKLAEARQSYARAEEIRPGSVQARDKVAAITAILTPPTPAPTPRPRKWVLVDVSEQRLQAYENDAMVFDWVCSTGEPGRPTRYGDFQVLDKIPEAWSSVWGLRMPFWLGIYWAGGSENGIHALPINMAGQTLWSGYLGRRVSFGCIILDTPNAAKLFDWAEIGTPVKIVP